MSALAVNVASRAAALNVSLMVKGYEKLVAPAFPQQLWRYLPII
jgi:hypothetical protein